MMELRFCGDFANQVTLDEIQQLAQIKRLFECLEGDLAFKKAYEDKSDVLRTLLKQKGIDKVDITAYQDFFDTYKERELQLKDIPDEEIAQYPQMKLWQQWMRAAADMKKTYIEEPFSSENIAFIDWRNRQIKRCSSQMSQFSSKHLVHAPVSFELSDGCSRHCFFCGLAAEPLKGIFPYTVENSQLWREVILTFKEKLGTDIGKGFCYWGTEPSDNPDYISFVRDFGDITGKYPQTTTAAASYRVAWTKDLLAFRNDYPTAADRFSVLSEKELRLIHENFSPEELLHVELILQYSQKRKNGMAKAGRNMGDDDNIHNDTTCHKVGCGENTCSDVNQEKTVETIEDHTIACVSGYLVNMVNKTIRLVSPCPPSHNYPNGFIVYKQGTFKNAHDVANFIDATVKEHMQSVFKEEDVITFRDDLEYEPLSQGFKLKSKYKAYQFKGKEYLPLLGECIAKGDQTMQQISERIMASQHDILKVLFMLEQLRKESLIMAK